MNTLLDIAGWLGIIAAVALVLYFGWRFLSRKRVTTAKTARTWQDTAQLLSTDVAPMSIVASPPVPPSHLQVSAGQVKFGTPALGYIDLTPTNYPPYRTVTQNAPLKPGERWPDGTHMPTREQTKAAIHAGIVRAVTGEVGNPQQNKPNLKPFELGRESEENIREALGELGLEGIDEIENWSDVMHLRARLGQGFGRAGGLGAYAPNSLKYVRERRQQRRARGEKIGFQR